MCRLLRWCSGVRLRSIVGCVVPTHSYGVPTTKSFHHIRSLKAIEAWARDVDAIQVRRVQALPSSLQTTPLWLAGADVLPGLVRSFCTPLLSTPKQSFVRCSTTQFMTSCGLGMAVRRLFQAYSARLAITRRSLHVLPLPWMVGAHLSLSLFAAIDRLLCLEEALMCCADAQ